MRTCTQSGTIKLLMECCELAGLPHAYDADGNFLPMADRPKDAHAIDFGGGTNSNIGRGPQVYRYPGEGSGHTRADDVFFRSLDQRRPHREVAMILAAIRDALEAVR